MLHWNKYLFLFEQSLYENMALTGFNYVFGRHVTQQASQYIKCLISIFISQINQWHQIISILNPIEERHTFGQMMDVKM